MAGREKCGLLRAGSARPLMDGQRLTATTELRIARVSSYPPEQRRQETDELTAGADLVNPRSQTRLMEATGATTPFEWSPLPGTFDLVTLQLTAYASRARSGHPLVAGEATSQCPV